MRRMLVMAAALVVLVANGWGVLQAVRNRADAWGGTLDLTERELRWLPMAAESTVILMRLNWRTSETDSQRHGTAAWLDVGKLEELGFDCRLSVNSPGARRHYTSLPARPVFLVLECRDDREVKPGPKVETRLFVVDASPDADALRQRYPDRKRHVVCRGLVRLDFRDRERNGNSLTVPRLEGRVENLQPGEVFVPLPQSRAIAGLRRPTFEDPVPKEARYSARLHWGVNYEPWVESVRLLTPEAKGP